MLENTRHRPTRRDPRPIDTPAPEQPDPYAGVAGASALREFQRRKQRREEGIRAAHPRLATMILSLADEPQSTRAWQTGAVGEQRLDFLAGDGVLVLHDRRVPGTRANIDHIAVGLAGVFVLDAKRYKGKRPERQVSGGMFRPRVERLVVGGRDRTNLLDGIGGQVDQVRTALSRGGGLPDVVVRGMLCFVGADWPMIGGSFQIRNFDVVWPRLAARVVRATGPLDSARIRATHQLLAANLPPA